MPAVARELIVIDDGPEPCGDLLPQHDRVRYVYLQGHHSIGAKFNLGCEMARANVMAAWADDDYHAPFRLVYQLGELVRNKRAQICGTDSLFYWAPIWDDEVWRYDWAPGQRTDGYVTGGTMMWRRAFWEQRPFDDLHASGEDTRWLAGRGPFLGTLDRTLYLATIHGRNTGSKERNLMDLSPNWERQVDAFPEMLAPVWWLDGVRSVVHGDTG